MKSSSKYAAHCVGIVVVIVAALAWLPPGVLAAAPTEYQLKAAFLLNFTKFVDWPANAFKSSQSPLSICVAGEDPFGRDLDETLKGQSVGVRALAVRRIAQPQKDDNCHILFVSFAERERFEKLIAPLKNYPCLTVGEEDDFAQAGGMINLLIEDKKIRFEVSLDIAERAGLKISSRLLKLAKNVRDQRKN